MSQKAYEDACLRAELFGEPKPDKEEFLAQHTHLDIVVFEEIDIKTGEETAMLSEDLKAAGGGLAELNTILDSTQTKLNRLKGVCGSITSFFRAKLAARDNISYSSEPSYVGQDNQSHFTKNDVTTPKAGSTNLVAADKEKSVSAGKLEDINTAITDLETMQSVKNTPIVSKATAKDMNQQINSQVSKLDALISKADRAQSSLQHQNNQMRSFLK